MKRSLTKRLAILILAQVASVSHGRNVSGDGQILVIGERDGDHKHAADTRVQAELRAGCGRETKRPNLHGMSFVYVSVLKTFAKKKQTSRPFSRASCGVLSCRMALK